MAVGLHQQHIADGKAAGQPGDVGARGKKQRFAGHVRAQAGVGARLHQHGGGLALAGGRAIAWVDQMAVAHAVQLKIALIIARGAQRLAVVQHNHRHRLVVARGLQAHLPGRVALAAQRQDITADID